MIKIKIKSRVDINNQPGYSSSIEENHWRMEMENKYKFETVKQAQKFARDQRKLGKMALYWLNSDGTPMVTVFDQVTNVDGVRL